MHSSTLNWVLSIVLFIVSGIALAEAADVYFCEDFTPNPFVSAWTNTGSREWFWSGAAAPPFAPTSFKPHNGGYVWFQDNLGAPNTGTIVSNTLLTINPSDEVRATIYRYIIEYDGSYRPVLKFVSGTDHQSVLWSFDDEVWTTVSILCGDMDEPCCLTYPCTGNFQVDGSILARDELLAIDSIALNYSPALCP